MNRYVRHSFIAIVTLALSPIEVSAQISMQEEMERLRAELPEGATLSYNHAQGSPYQGEGSVTDIVIVKPDDEVAELKIDKLVARDVVMKDGEPEKFAQIAAENLILRLEDGTELGADRLELLDFDGLAAMLGGMENLGAIDAGATSLNGAWITSGPNRFKVDKVGFSSITEGLLRGLVIDGIDFSGVDPEDGNEFHVSLATITYDWFRIDSEYWQAYAQKFVEVEQLPEEEQFFEALTLTATMADDFGPAHASDMSIRADDMNIVIGEMGSRIDGIDGGGFSMSIEMSGFGIGPGSKIEGRDVSEVIERLGIDSFLGTWGMAFTVDDAGGKLAVDSFRIGWQDVIEAEFALTVNGDRPLEQLRSLQNGANIDVQTIDIGLASAFVKLSAGSQFNNLLEFAAEEQGLPPEQLPAMISAQLSALSSALPERSPRIDNVLQAVGQFFQNPGTFHLQLSPASPVRFQDLMFGAMVAPTQLLETLNLTALSVAHQ